MLPKEKEAIPAEIMSPATTLRSRSPNKPHAQTRATGGLFDAERALGSEHWQLGGKRRRGRPIGWESRMNITCIRP